MSYSCNRTARYISLACVIPLILSGLMVNGCNGQSQAARDAAVLEDAMRYGQPATVEQSHIEPIYPPPLKGRIYAIKPNGEWGLYDTVSQKEISPVIYDQISLFNDEETVYFSLNKKYGYLNAEGKEIVPATYDFTTGFSNGLAAVRQDRKWGYINKKGVVAIPIAYKTAGTFDGGMGAVQKEGKWGFIDTGGTYVLPPEYDDITYGFHGSKQLANVSKGSRHFYIDRKGKYVKPAVPYEKSE